MPAFQDLTGQQFDKLVVLRRVANVGRYVMWECQCDCGNLTTVKAENLKDHNTQSCGCLNHVKVLVDIDWDDPVSRNVRRRELYAVKVAAGHKRIRTAAYYARKRKRKLERYAENPEKAKEQTRQGVKRYRKKHPERVTLYRKTHPEIHQTSRQRRRAALLQAERNDFTQAQWIEMQNAYDHRCAYCGKRAKGHLTQEHITPLSKGGSNTASNIVPACRSCNSTKHAGPVLVPVQPLLLTIAPPKPMKKRA